MKNSLALACAALALATTQSIAFAEMNVNSTVLSSSVTSSDEIAARNSARDYLEANYFDTLRKRDVDLNKCLFTVSYTQDGDLLVVVEGTGISAEILLSQEEYEVLNAQVNL